MIANPSLSDATVPAPEARSSPAIISLAWIVVVLPLAWGVYNTVKTSSHLFMSNPPAASTPGNMH